MHMHSDYVQYILYVYVCLCKGAYENTEILHVCVRMRVRAAALVETYFNS